MIFFPDQFALFYNDDDDDGDYDVEIIFFPSCTMSKANTTPNKSNCMMNS